MALGDDVQTILVQLGRIAERLDAIDVDLKAGTEARHKCQDAVFRRLGRAEKVLAVICAVPAIVAATAGAVWGIARALKGLVLAALAALAALAR